MRKANVVRSRTFYRCVMRRRKVCGYTFIVREITGFDFSGRHSMSRGLGFLLGAQTQVGEFG